MDNDYQGLEQSFDERVVEIECATSLLFFHKSFPEPGQCT